MANPHQPDRDTSSESEQVRFKHINDEPISPLIDSEMLGYEAYAEVLVDRIVSSKTPITIGISGSWGSGKSSLMNLIDSKLAEQRTRYRVFCPHKEKVLGEYNSRHEIPKHLLSPCRDQPNPGPEKHRVQEIRRQSIWVPVWQLNTQEEVWDAFVQSLVTHVRKEMKWWKRIRYKEAAKQLLRSGYLLVLAIVPAVVGTYLGNPKPNETTWTDVFQLLMFKGPFHAPAPLTGALLTYGLALWALRQPIKAAWQFDVKKILVTGSYEARITELGKLSSQFREFVKSLVGENGRLVVFIDDLDRCSPQVIPKVLEAIKLFAATERCVYVLGIDYGAVWKAIKESHGFPNEEDGARYLEKIIQIPFQLPALSEATVDYYLRALSPELDDEVRTVFAFGLESNPRALKRALQIYYTWMDLAERGLKRWEVDPVEPELIAKWLIIQSRYPTVRDFIARRKEYLLWLELHALNEASKDGRLKKEDRPSAEGIRVWPEAGPQIEDAPELAPAVKDSLDALLIKGNYRFNDRRYRDTLDSYIYLGGTAATLERDVRAQSRERSLLLASRHHEPDEPQKFINQLLAFPGIGRYRKSDAAGKIKAYIDRLKEAVEAPGILTSDEREEAKSAEQTLTDELNQLTDSRLPFYFWHHAMLRIPTLIQYGLGSDEEEIKQAIADHLDPELAERERVESTINIPSFRIGRFPVTNQEFEGFIGQPPEAVPFGIVEYEAYCEPVFEEHWNADADSTLVLSEPNGGQVKLRLDAGANGLSATLSSPQGELFGEVSLPLMSETNEVLRSEGLIVLLTLGDDYGLEAYRKSVPVDRLTVRIRAWQTGRTISLKRDWESESYSFWDNPVVNVSWEDAVAYCVWLRRVTGRPYRLPKEPEWQGAAGWSIYPWGDIWNPALANTQESGQDKTLEVKHFSPDGDSPFAIADMVGNVWEWCADVYGEVQSRPGMSGLLWDDVRFRGSADVPQKKITRSARGGSFRDTKAYARIRCRASFEPTHKSRSVGFRVAIASEFEGLANK